MNLALPNELLKALGQLDACTLANAIETFQVRLRNEGFADHAIRCLFPHLPAMVGHATTVTIRGSAPPTADSPYADRTDWWDYICTVPTPRVVVIQDVASRPGLAALVGGVHMHILQALECIGVVTNGSVRSLPAAESAGFHYFAKSVSVSHGYVHIVEIGKPVEVGGLKIQSGDLVHGDLHGVQTIPLTIAPRIPSVAAEIQAHKNDLIALCRSPEFTLDKLRRAVKAKYPR